MSRLMIALVVLLSLAVAGLFLAKHENARLRASLDRANNVASGQQTTITMLKNQLHVALTRADKNELAQVALRIDVRSGPCHAPAHDYPLLQSDGAALTQRVYLCTPCAR